MHINSKHKNVRNPHKYSNFMKHQLAWMTEWICSSSLCVVENAPCQYLNENKINTTTPDCGITIVGKTGDGHEMHFAHKCVSLKLRTIWTV